MVSASSESAISRSHEPYRWEAVPVHPYKEDGGTHFKSITRQTLFTGGDDMNVELRYFEVQPGGHSTLERHQHTHLVMVARGGGQVMVGEEISEIALHDTVRIAPFTWHQFRATTDEPLGFLCIVSCDRDRPQRPGPSELEELRSNPAIAEFIRV